MVDLVAMAGLSSMLRGKEKVSAHAPDPSGWRSGAAQEIHMLRMFQPLFLFTRWPCASNDINSMIGTSMHVIYAGIETRVHVGQHPGHAAVKKLILGKPRLNSTHALPSLSPSGP
jgi:hypothetical protein